MAWLSDINIGTVATVLTTVSLVMIGAVVKAIQAIGPVWEDYCTLRAKKQIEIESERERAKVEWEKFRQGSFSEQIEKLKATVAEANGKLDEIRERASEDSKKHSEESLRLTKQLELSITQNEHMIRVIEDMEREKEELLNQVSLMGQRVEVNAHRIEKIVSDVREKPPCPESEGSHP